MTTYIQNTRLPLLIQTFLLNLVGILAMNWSPDGVNTSWKLFPFPPKTYECRSHELSQYHVHTRFPKRFHMNLLLNSPSQSAALALAQQNLLIPLEWHASSLWLLTWLREWHSSHVLYSAAIFITVTQSLFWSAGRAGAFGWVLPDLFRFLLV